MRIKIISVLLILWSFLAVQPGSLVFAGDKVTSKPVLNGVSLLPDAEEVYSKLPKNPGGDPEMPEDEWDALDEKLADHPNNCVKCHYEEEKYAKMTMDWATTKHGKNKVDCSKCHGGNPDSKTLKEAKGQGTKFKKLPPGFKNQKGPLSSFNDLAFEYCGQCHGTIYRDWKTGIHGKRTGSWNGEKEYRLCVYCHNPHNPKFPQLKPMPRPWTPYEMHGNYFSQKANKGAQE